MFVCAGVCVSVGGGEIGGGGGHVPVCVCVCGGGGRYGEGVAMYRYVGGGG